MDKEKIVVCQNCGGLRMTEAEEKDYNLEAKEKFCICPRNAQGGREYRIKAPVGKLIDPDKKDMNDVVKIAMEKGFKREPIQLQSNMGLMNIFAWQKDIMSMEFWGTLGEAIAWNERPKDLAMKFFELCMTAGWSHAVEYLLELIKLSGIWEKK
jgi:hypothetical protein